MTDGDVLQPRIVWVEVMVVCWLEDSIHKMAHWVNMVDQWVWMIQLRKFILEIESVQKSQFWTNGWNSVPIGPSTCIAIPCFCNRYYRLMYTIYVSMCVFKKCWLILVLENPFHTSRILYRVRLRASEQEGKYSNGNAQREGLATGLLRQYQTLLFVFKKDIVKWNSIRLQPQVGAVLFLFSVPASPY